MDSTPGDTASEQARGRLRVAIVVDGPRVPAAVARAIDLVVACQIDLAAICVAPSRGRRPAAALAAELVARIERIRIRPKVDAFAQVQLGGALRARLSTFPGDPSRIVPGRLDLVVDLTSSGFETWMPMPAAAPTWSLRLGSDRLPVGPPAFVRDFLRGIPEAATELVVHDGTGAEAPSTGGARARILYASPGALDRRSPFRTQSAAAWKAAELPARMLRGLVAGSMLGGATDGQAGCELGGPPVTVADVVRLVATMAGRGLSESIHRLRFQPRWLVAVAVGRAGAGAAEPADLAGFRPLDPPPGRFYADPCLVRSPAGTQLFVEDGPIGGGPARISTLGLGGSGEVTSGPSVVLARGTHLSYPFVFSDAGEWYLLPETAATGTVELFRARQFPGEWEPAGILLSGIRAFDPTLLAHGGRYWLFAAVAGPGADPSDELWVFWADSLLGPWHPHARNPVVSDARHARPAGRVLEREGALIRPAQDGRGGYGTRIVLNRIDELSPTEYRETEIGAIEPLGIAGVTRTHTYARAGDVEAVDGLRYEPRWWRRARRVGAGASRPPRVLLVVTSLARGGAPQQVVDLALALRTRGWEVAVMALTTPAAYVDELTGAGVELVSLHMRRGRPTLGGLTGYGSFLRRWRPDVVHSHMVHANLLARAGRIFAPRTPVVCTVHTVREGPRWRAVAYRLTDRLADATTAVSGAAAERSVEVGSVPRGRIVVLPNGFDLARARVTPAERETARAELAPAGGFLWVAVGRLVPEKGHAMLLDAFESAHRSRGEARLVVVGDGPERAALDAQVAARGLAGAVALVGERTDVPAILAASDAFVMSSRWEGLPMALLEAAAQGLPIVSTDVGGCREIARPDLGAILVRPDPGEIAEAMVRVMDTSPEDRSGIGRGLRENVESGFDMTRVVARWEALYGRVMARVDPASGSGGAR